MSKRKILLMALALCLVAILAVGGTLAYLTDEEVKHNVFTVGNVDVTLDEVFDEDNAHILPGLQVEKVVTVTNVGTEDAFVRVWLAIPKEMWGVGGLTLLPEGVMDDMEDAWQWSTICEDGQYVKIGDQEYHVEVVTYVYPLATGDTTPAVIEGVYMNTSVTNEDMQALKSAYGNYGFKILVAVEAGQTAGFEEAGAENALNVQFGVPGPGEDDHMVEWKLDETLQ